MLMLISPAKSLDMQVSYPDIKPTELQFLADSQLLIDQLQELNPEEIKNLMGISEKLAELNYQRFQNWVASDAAEECPALYAFKGDVYQGIAVDAFQQDDIAYAQKNLRILSGLYGLLRPLDKMQAYRLEMGTKFTNTRGANLYAFWGDKITDLVNQDMAENQSTELINLASNEYFKAVKKKAIAHKIITPIFKDYKNGKYKIISFYAKKARGLMVAFAVKNKLQQAEQLKDFTSAGYYFSTEQSNETEWVFLREAVE
ncbi:MAG: peroxide stress protein YaaA [Methyloprofundus sp.]|nr:peroxide stress protein YaaA [Methyloprofundus sp.]